MSDVTRWTAHETLAGFESLSRQAAELEAQHGYQPGSGPVVITHEGLDRFIAVARSAEARRRACAEYEANHMKRNWAAYRAAYRDAVIAEDAALDALGGGV